MILLCPVAACVGSPAPGTVAPPVAAAPSYQQVSPDLEVARLAPGIWLHRSYSLLSDGNRFSSNGLLIREDDHLILVDTAWGAGPTRDLLAWVDAELALPIRWAVATHHHDDRLGGAEELAARGIELAAHPLTFDLARQAGNPLPSRRLEGLGAPGSAVVLGSLEIFFPGPGHADDNVVVWHAPSETLHGGCAVRSAKAQSMGNTADADLPSWGDAIERLLEPYPNPRWVIPGHGAPGGVELLEHTAALLAEN